METGREEKMPSGPESFAEVPFPARNATRPVFDFSRLDPAGLTRTVAVDRTTLSEVFHVVRTISKGSALPEYESCSGPIDSLATVQNGARGDQRNFSRGRGSRFRTARTLD